MRQATLLKIMELLRMNLNKGMTILEISKKLKIGYRPAYNHINEMMKEGIITTKTVGHAKQSFLNLKNEKCRHILGEVAIVRKAKLYKKNAKLQSILEGLVSKIIEKHFSQVHAILLFGSYAKNKADKSSDIDILFIVSDMKNRKLKESIERVSATFHYSHKMQISPVISDTREFKKMLKDDNLNIGKEALDYGIPLLGAEQFWRLTV